MNQVVLAAVTVSFVNCWMLCRKLGREQYESDANFSPLSIVSARVLLLYGK